jgi:hypothetical protein
MKSAILSVNLQHAHSCRYAKMLLLRKQHKATMCPTYDIDIAWHAHMTLPEEYCSDTEALLGEVYSHDDSINDRSPDGVPLSFPFTDTVKIFSKIN